MTSKLVLIVFVLLPGLVKSQSKAYRESPADSRVIIVYDTMVVYDTLVVYDTVYTKKSIPDLLVKEKELPNQLTHFIFDSKAATIFRSDIITDKSNNNMIAMKKITFMGALFFLFQHSVLAQTHAGISAGTVVWRMDRQPVQYQQSNISWCSDLRILETHLTGKFSLGLAISYTLMRKGADYKVTGNYFPQGQWHPDASYLDDEADAINAYFSSDRHQVSFPVRVIGTFNRWKPFVGAEYTTTSYAVEEIHNNTTVREVYARTDMGINGGLSYKIGKVEIEAAYYSSLSTHQAEMSSIYGYSYGFERLSLSLRYFLR